MMEKNNSNWCGRVLAKLYGGLDMGWPAVVLFAVGTAVLTAFFLIVPVFKDTSFHEMGVTVEAWIFFAVIIMANCKKPLESAFKVFVFFLVSQPLIYLFQVPFSYLGWQLFKFYPYWFKLTLLTFPVAFVGWYINKKNWLSALILLPVLVFLAVTGYNGFLEAFRVFPRHLLVGVFCVLQILIYVVVFIDDWRLKLAGLLIPVAATVVFAARTPQVNLTVIDYLPDDPVLTADSVVTLGDESLADVKITDYEQDYVSIYAHKYGSTTMKVTDGENEYTYTVEIYDDKGVNRIQITPKEE